jgi:hypothetical protein
MTAYQHDVDREMGHRPMPSNATGPLQPLQPFESSTVDMRSWAPIKVENGTAFYRLDTWAQFYDFLDQTVFSTQEGRRRRTYVWRGHRRDDWSLSSTLHRLFEDLGLLRGHREDLDLEARDHLAAFKLAARGRRGSAPLKLDENEWWALGQHYGLATPLLDWCRSPFAAAYFAFEQRKPDHTGYRVIYGLDRQAVELESARVDDGEPIEKGTLPIVQFIEPMSDDNPRLVSQAGLFTRTPLGITIEDWVLANHERFSEPVLIRIEVPDTNRKEALLALDRMNINHSSLFPDLTGASRCVNLNRELGVS